MAQKFTLQQRIYLVEYYLVKKHYGTVRQHFANWVWWAKSSRTGLLAKDYAPLQSMRNNLRQLPDLTFSKTLAGILRGWDLTMKRNEKLHLWQSIRTLFLSESATIFCENFLTNVDMHGRFARWRKWRACDVGEAKEGLENELWRRSSNGRVGEWVVT